MVKNVINNAPKDFPNILIIMNALIIMNVCSRPVAQASVLIQSVVTSVFVPMDLYSMIRP